MPPKEFPKYQSIRIPAECRNIAGELTDPDTLTLILDSPDDAGIEYVWPSGEVTRESEGLFYFDIISPSADGWWNYKWVSTGEVAGATDDIKFWVKPSDLD